MRIVLNFRVEKNMKTSQIRLTRLEIEERDCESKLKASKLKTPPFFYTIHIFIRADFIFNFCKRPNSREFAMFNLHYKESPNNNLPFVRTFYLFFVCVWTRKMSKLWEYFNLYFISNAGIRLTNSSRPKFIEGFVCVWQTANGFQFMEIADFCFDRRRDKLRQWQREVRKNTQWYSREASIEIRKCVSMQGNGLTLSINCIHHPAYLHFRGRKRSWIFSCNSTSDFQLRIQIIGKRLRFSYRDFI